MRSIGTEAKSKLKQGGAMSFILRTLLPLCTLMVLSSCFSTGRNFPSRVDWIKKGTTKKKDVELVLGKPFAVGISGGTSTWTYAFYKYELLGRTAYKELKIYWNSNDSIKNYSFNSSFNRDTKKRSALKLQSKDPEPKR